MAKLYQVCCLKYNNKTDFYRYEKDVHKSINVKNVGISGLKTIPTNQSSALGQKNIQYALFVGKRCMCGSIDTNFLEYFMIFFI